MIGVTMAPAGNELKCTKDNKGLVEVFTLMKANMCYSQQSTIGLNKVTKQTFDQQRSRNNCFL